MVRSAVSPIIVGGTTRDPFSLGHTIPHPDQQQVRFLSMGSAAPEKPHALCLPLPFQGHITPMLKLAKILHSRGFHVTFVNTHYNHARLLRSRGPSSLDGLPEFHFASIPDGLPESDAADVTQSVPDLCRSLPINSSAPLRRLLADLNQPSSGAPRVSCMVVDGGMNFAVDAARELRIPVVLFVTLSAHTLSVVLHLEDLIRRDLTPVRDGADLEKDEFMERRVEGIAGMEEGMAFKDLPTFVRTTDPDDVMILHLIDYARAAGRSSAIAVNTFEDLERPVLDALRAVVCPPLYSVGPLNLVCGQTWPLLGSNLWEEDRGCLEWLEGRPAESVVYVNFGSIAVMTGEQFVEFAWGLANCGSEFLWVIRPDLVGGEEAALPAGFAEATRGRGLLARWCPQEEVLRHPAVGGFLTHCGWNSVLESLCGGVPVVCWPFFADQQTNCRCVCGKWGVGVEVGSRAGRREVEGVVRELMGGEEGRRRREKAREWKDRAAAAAAEGGTSFRNIDELVRNVLTATGPVLPEGSRDDVSI